MKYSAIAMAGLALPLKFGVGSASAYAVSPAIQKFLDPMLLFGSGIPLATKVLGVYDDTTVDYYEITAASYRYSLGTGVANAFPGYTGTQLYGYRDTALTSNVHLGGAILATKGKPVRIKFSNALPSTHMLPVDTTIPGAETGQRKDRIAVHLHGGLVPWTSDGGPFHWVTNPGNPGGLVRGASVIDWLPNASGTPTDDYYWPNNQSGRVMWYHDHAFGITRINAYSGLATGYIIAGDPVETALGLPFADPIAFQDKIFWNPTTDPNYSLYVPGALAGDLWYPYLYEKQIWKLQGGKNAKMGAALPIPSAVAEMFGDTMLANGKVYPYHYVNAGMYRFRLLNACQGRFLNLSFVVDAGNGEPLLNKKGLPVAAPVSAWVIGSEGGFLPTPVQIFTNGVPASLNALLMGPAERFDIIIDFSLCGNTNVILYNNAPAPYPGGNPIFDYFFGAPGVMAGFGPNTRTIMQFRVSGTPGPTVTVPASIPIPVLDTVADTTNGGLALSPTQPNYPGYTIMPTTQELTLNETFDMYGRLTQLVGTNVVQPGGGFGRPYLSQPTEFVGYNTIQIWNVYNLTADMHPMHFHLFNVMVLRRRPFKVSQFNGLPVFTALGVGPDPTEKGWKETVKMPPGVCTTVAVLVEPPLVGNTRNVTVTANGGATHVGTLPFSPRLLSSYGISGDEYVWHCHILEHEEHDMMRPLVGS